MLLTLYLLFAPFRATVTSVLYFVKTGKGVLLNPKTVKAPTKEQINQFLGKFKSLKGDPFQVRSNLGTFSTHRELKSAQFIWVVIVVAVAVFVMPFLSAHICQK